MANTIKCGECKKYAAIERPLRSKKGGSINTRKGHCLARTTYAKNRPGSDVYPPNAKLADLPNGAHDIFLVREDHLMLQCLDAVKR